MVGCGEGVVYLTSSGHSIDIGLQFGKACYPCSRCFYFLCFLAFIPVLFSFLSLSFITSTTFVFLLSLFSLSLGDDTE